MKSMIQWFKADIQLQISTENCRVLVSEESKISRFLTAPPENAMFTFETLDLCKTSLVRTGFVVVRLRSKLSKN
jgi:hypothetical protein